MKKNYTVIFMDASFPNDQFYTSTPEEAAEEAIEKATELMKQVDVTLYLLGGLKVYDNVEYNTSSNPKPVYEIDKTVTIN